MSPRLAQRLRLRGSTIRGCFDPEDALKFEELQFFAFGNELVDRLVMLPLDEDVRVAVRTDPTLPPGLWAEAWYEIESSDVNPIGQFIRHVVGSDLAVQSTVIQEMPPLGSRVRDVPSVPDWVSGAMAASQARFQSEYEDLRSSARRGLAARQAEARGRAHRISEYRQNRLEGLILEEGTWILRAEQT